MRKGRVQAPLTLVARGVSLLNGAFRTDFSLHDLLIAHTYTPSPPPQRSVLLSWPSPARGMVCPDFSSAQAHPAPRTQESHCPCGSVSPHARFFLLPLLHDDVACGVAFLCDVPNFSRFGLPPPPLQYEQRLLAGEDPPLVSPSGRSRMPNPLNPLGSAGPDDSGQSPASPSDGPYGRVPLLHARC